MRLLPMRLLPERLLLKRLLLKRLFLGCKTRLDLFRVAREYTRAAEREHHYIHRRGATS